MAKVQYIKCDSCGDTPALELRYDGESFTDAAGSRDFQGINRDLCTKCMKKVLDVLVMNLCVTERIEKLTKFGFKVEG